MKVQKHESLPILSEEDVVRVRRAVKTLATECGLGGVDQTKLMTAASELARNALKYGGGGVAQLEIVSDGPRQGLRLVVEDNGPGIFDVELAMKDGYTSGKGLGLGLGGTRRLMSEFEITSTIGEGTCVRVVKWK